MKEISAFAFLLIYIAFGKKAAIPYGVLIFKNPVLIITSLCFLDIIQAFLIVLLFDIKPIKRFSAKVQEHLDKSRWVEKHKGWEYLGIFLIAANPFFGGGILVPTIISHLLKLKREKFLPLVILGDFAGALILMAIYSGLLIGVREITLFHSVFGK